MITLDISYSQSDALETLRKQAGKNGVVVGELVDGHLQCHAIDAALGSAIRSVVKEHVAFQQKIRGAIVESNTAKT